MELILVDQLEDTNNERLSLAMPHSGLKPKNENDPKEEVNIRWWTILDGRRFRWMTPFYGRQPLTDDDL